MAAEASFVVEGADPASAIPFDLHPGNKVKVASLLKEFDAGRIKYEKRPGVFVVIEEGPDGLSLAQFTPSSTVTIRITPSQAAAPVGVLKVLITFKKGKQQHEHDFNGTPSWSVLVDVVETAFKELQAEDFKVRAGKLPLDAENWIAFAKGKTSMTLRVISLAQSFSSFDEEDAFTLLNTSVKYVEEDDNAFPEAAFEPNSPLEAELASVVGLKTQGDLLSHVGTELALRCFHSGPSQNTKEASRRELISPILFAVAVLAGSVDVLAEHSARGTLARGSIHYVLLYKYFSIVVVEGKLHDRLAQHLGQLAAEMRTAREEYKRKQLGKRKYESEGLFEEVPSFGVLSSGTTYILYKYSAGAKHFIKGSVVELSLKRGISAANAAQEAAAIIKRLLHVVLQQKQSMQDFENKRSRNS